MRIEASAMQLTLRVRGQPKVKGELIEFVRTKSKRAKHERYVYGNAVASSQHHSKSYSRGY